VLKQYPHACDEYAWHLARPQTQEVLDLRRGDQQRDAVGEADGHWPRDELHRSAQPGQAHDQEHAAGHERYHRQARRTKLRQDPGDNHHERACRPADLQPAASQRRDQEAGYYRRVDAGLRRHAGGNAEGHGKG
jgi:hypothetical protein